MTQRPYSSDHLVIPEKAVLRVGLGVGAIVIATLLVVAGVAIGRNTTDSSTLAPSTLVSNIDTSRFQAVFLSSNEVYFGRLGCGEDAFCTLRDVHRLTVLPSAHPGQPVQRLLVRVTKDIHSPLDLMVINRSQILYVENLNPNGKVGRFLQLGG
ncbi:MAG: hypothetical protein ACR2GA_02280 [Chloroflexota bacterium]